MLEIIKGDNRFNYEVRVKSNNKLIGHFIQDVDGFFYFSDIQEGKGLWSDYVLLELGDKLKEINKPWVDALNDYFMDNQ